MVKLSHILRTRQSVRLSSFLLIAAPELLVSSPDDHKGYGMEVDIWSLGVLLYCALTNTTPFKSKGKLYTDDA